MFTWIPLAAAGLALFIGAASAATPALNPLESDARALEAALMAPCCYAQQVSVHQSEAAAQVRADVRERLARGETRQQIVDAYVARYGKRILAEPPAAGFDLSLYVLPAVLFGITLGLLARFLRRISGHPRESAAELAAATTDLRFDQRLNRELRDLD